MTFRCEEDGLTGGRDQEWLECLLAKVWQDHFFDVERHNPIRIVYGRKAKRRLGSISLDRNDPKVSIIRMNGLFKNEDIPEFIVTATIVHELCHYAHGFFSGIDRPKQRYPHSGGVIRREFAERGLEALHDRQQEWLKQNWLRIVSENFAPPKRKTYQKTSYIRFFKV